MTFFSNFPVVDYNFGDEIDPAFFQNLTAYIDILDQVKDDISFYETYTIRDDERPEVLSQRLYGTMDFYYQFYLLNDKLRQQGWPLSEQDVYSQAKEYYPNRTLFTDRSMHGEFYVGDYVAPNTGAGFVNPDFKARILEKNYDLGTITVKPLIEVRSVTITSGGSGYTSIPTVTLSGGSGEGATAAAVIDSDPLSATYKQVTAITITAGGEDFTAAPTVTVSDPDEASGDKATATATLSSNTLSIPNNDTVTIYSKKGDIDVKNWNLSDIEPLLIWKSEGQHEAPHHFEDADGNWSDLNYIPDTQYGVNNHKGEIIVGGNSVSGYNGKTVITHTQRLKRENDSLRTIKILKPNVAGQVHSEFQRLLRQ